tara:strand:+ start:723 stop:866 length:144 start_codon:yes stop_codon:yes gene_type:complete
LLDWDLADAAEKAEAIAAGKTMLRELVRFVGWAGFTFGFTLFAIAVT